MQLKTILNRVHKQRGFVYGKAEFVQPKQGPEVLEVEVKPAARTQPVCSGCGKKGPGYDRLSVRRFEFVPLWVETILTKRGPSIAGTAGKPRDLLPHPWIRKFARLDVQRLELWALQPPSRRAKRSK